MEKITFRKARPKDYEKINELYQGKNFLGEEKHPIAPMGREYFRRFIKSKNAFIATKGADKYFGYALLNEFENGKCRLTEIYVKEQGKGYGVEFFNFLYNLVKAKGFKKIVLCSMNEYTDKFWEKLGFVSIQNTWCDEKFYEMSI